MASKFQEEPFAIAEDDLKFLDKARPCAAGNAIYMFLTPFSARK